MIRGRLAPLHELILSLETKLPRYLRQITEHNGFIDQGTMLRNSCWVPVVLPRWPLHSCSMPSLSSFSAFLLLFLLLTLRPLFS